MIEVTIKRTKDDVREALVQFCSRRGYRLTEPWYLEGIRIEVPNRVRDDIHKRGFWATVMDTPTMPRIDVDIKRKRGGAARLKITFGDHNESVRLAYELQAYLNDDRAYEAACPPICTSCGNNVPNPIARYCGRCGHRFVADAGDGVQPMLRPPPVVADGRHRLAVDPTEAILIERNENRAAPRAEAMETEVPNIDGFESEPPVEDAATPSDAAPTIEAGPETNSPMDNVASASPPTERIVEAIDIDEEDSVTSDADTDEDDENERVAETDNEDEASIEPADDADDDPRPSRRLMAEE